MKLSKSKEYIRVKDEQNDYLRMMKQDRRDLKLPHSYIECMIKVFNEIMNKNDDPNVVPQEDLLNHKPPIPAKLELPPSFEETLEALRQDWYDLAISHSDGEPWTEELDLK
ncbi:hypothetical protein R1flu_014240 [Riccia fluitans]|uniref:Uncharacterized protein n=1 Tax=Riccia fluitans TaxID=41844 RepID=A0ABD1YFI8_9MARC